MSRQFTRRRRHGDARRHRSTATVRLTRPGRRTRPHRATAGAGVHRVGRRRDHRGVPRLRRPHARRGGTTAVSPKPSRSSANEGTAWCSTARRAIDSLNASERQLVSDDSRRHHRARRDHRRACPRRLPLLHRDADSEYAVTALTAPVFGPDGEIILVLTLVGFAGPVRADTLPRYAARMFEATSAIEATMTGRRGQP